MQTELNTFLNGRSPLATETAAWPAVPMTVRISAYLSRELPPADHITSVRAVLFRGQEVMVIRDGANRYHVTPGGRLESGESLEKALRREVLEETGWSIADNHLFAVLHYQHLTPKPPEYNYPYPHFLQLIYLAQAGTYHPAAHEPGEYEVETGFRPIAEARALLQQPIQASLLAAALKQYQAGT